MSWKSEISRRPLLAGLVGLLGLGAAGGAAYEAMRFTGEEHTPGAYDDLIVKLSDRDSAKAVGQAVIDDLPKFNSAAVARILRRKIGKNKLASVTVGDLANGRLAEADGWVLPESVALICALAAKAG